MKRIPPVQTVPRFLRDERFHEIGWVLDEEPSWIVGKLVSLLSSNVRVDDYVVDQIRRLATLGPVVYAMKFQSVYDLHFLRIRFAELGLPLPAFVFGASVAATGSLSKLYSVYKAEINRRIRPGISGTPSEGTLLKEIFEQGGAGVMFLVDHKSFRSRYVHPHRDPLRILLDVQGRVAGCISVAPLFILYDRTIRPTIRPFWESFLGDPDRPGPLRRILLALRRWTVPEVLMGEPVHLLDCFEEFGAQRSWEELPFDLRTELIDKINARIRVNRGPERLSRTEIKERVLQDERVQALVAEMVEEENTTPEKIRRKAEAYVDEIAADQRLQAIHFLYRLIKWLSTHVFNGIDMKVTQFTPLKRIGQKGSLIFVPCHKSHFDYLFTPFITFANNMAVPHVAAGKNLSFWPIGPLLRHSGAFFLRRSFKGLKLYTGVFEAYVRVLLQEKYNVKFFIEGGRSRTGMFLQPRLGMLSFLLRAVEDGAVEDLYFVPTFIGYEQIPEEKSYLREMSGLDKKKESLGSIIRAREILRKRYGRVYVRFQAPLSFQEFREEWARFNERRGNQPANDNKLVRDFGYRLMWGIIRMGVITSVDLTATALRCLGNGPVKLADLVDGADLLAQIIRDQDIEFADNLHDFQDAVPASLGLFVRRGFVDMVSSDEASAEPRYLINEQKRAFVHFYGNTLVSYLWPASLLATALSITRPDPLEINASVRDRFMSLVEILSGEFILDPLKEVQTVFDETVGLFRKNGLVRPPDPSQTGNRAQWRLDILKRVLSDLVEAYYLVLICCDEIEEGMSQKEFGKKVQKRNRDADGESQTETPLLISVATVGNALTRLSRMQIIDYDESKKYVNGLRDPQARDQWKRLLATALGKEGLR